MLIRTLTIAGATGIAAPALAQNATDSDYVLPSRDAADPLRKGAYVPFTVSPSADGARAQTFASYDSARNAARLDASGQIPVIERLQLRVGLGYDQGDSDPGLAAQFDVLRERSAPIDLQLSAGWEDEGVNDVSAAFAEATLGRSLPSDIYAFGGARFDLGTDGEEVGMRVTAAAVRPMGFGLVAGIDSKLDIVLEEGADEPPDESAWAFHVGPLVGYSNDLVALTASVGLATDEARADGDTEVGVYAGAGLGIAL
jgi:hypothetical protein